MRAVTIDDLLASHAALFFDAYGVLVDGHGALAGARELVARLEREKTRYFILTNDASRLPETMEARFAGFGLPIPKERIVSSGDLLTSVFAARGLVGARSVVLGPPDAHALGARAGGTIVPHGARQDFDVLVIGDESGFPFLEALDDVLSMLFRKLDAGQAPVLLLPNPDLLYPKRAGEFGFAAGTIARMLEDAIDLRFPEKNVRFLRLGKPHAPIFAEACRRADTRDAVMIGDQLHTDILGANDFGIASALVDSGLARWDATTSAGIRPNYLLTSLA